MKIYRPKYFIVDWVAQTVRHIVNVAQKCLPSSGAKPGASSLSMASWIEILQTQPNCYLRLALTMDLSISNGKLPDETDFPPGLRYMLHGRITVSPEAFPLALPDSLTEKAKTTQEHPDESVSRAQNTPPGLSSQGELGQDSLLGDRDNAGDLGANFVGISSCPNMLPNLDFPGLEPSWGTIGPGALVGDSMSLGLKPDTMFSPFQFQTFNFEMGNGQACSNPSAPTAVFPWDDGQSNNAVSQVELDSSILDAIRVATNANLTANDERLLEELDRVMNMA